MPDPELEEIVVAALEASLEDRAALLERLEREDGERARRVRSRLDTLGELGMTLDREAGVPERFGSYERLERVGSGGMGEVFLARDTRDGSPAALKLVRPEHLLFGTARVRFGREIQASSQLRHPGIVRVLDVGEAHGVPWLAMEWVGGVSLEEALERLRNRPPESLGPRDLALAIRAASGAHPCPEPADEAAFPGATHVEVVTRLVARVARALAHAHEEGVLHRDVKPSNVLVTPSGRVLLSDFGLALPRGADRMTRTGQWLGSLPYAAPEQIEGSPRALDARVDVYALAATLYELVTLRTPFLGGLESAVRRRILTGDLEAPRRFHPGVPRTLERLLLAALDPDPRRRPASAAAFADDLERALSGLPVHARGAPAWLRARRWVRRRPRLALTGALAALAVSGSLAVAWREKALAAQLVRLGDAELVHALEEEAGAFWPAAPEALAAMDGWLRRADALLRRQPEHRQAYETLLRRALPYRAEDREHDQALARETLVTLTRELDGLEAFVATGDRNTPPDPPTPEVVRAREAALHELLERPETIEPRLHGRIEALRAVMARDPALWRPDVQQLDDFERVLKRDAAVLRQRATFRFADSLDAWRHESLRRLLEDLEQLEDLVPKVREQREVTRALDERFVGTGAGAWARAIDDVRRSARYGGLVLEPLFGLDPLGIDAGTGLAEFVVLASGAAPGRDGQGRWRMEEGSGIVLVLLPGGRFRMGQRADEGEPLLGASPVHEVELAPFLCSRYELTVAQAERLDGFPADRKRPTDGRMPLILDWERSRAMLLRHGLELPTEAQWEYAARAGEAAMPLQGHANLYDLSRIASLRAEGMPTPDLAVDFDDGWPGLAPVGSLAPNAFGLHDVLGNVAEWCLDAYVMRGYSTLAPRVGDGLRATVVAAQLRVIRGGSYCEGPAYCCPWKRWYEAPGKLAFTIGVRPVRAIR